MKVSFLATYIAGVMIAVLMAGPVFAAAQTTPAPATVSLKTKVMIEKTVTENGTSSTKLVELKNVVPGDRLVYTFRYRNDGAVAATNYVMIDPLPSAVVLAPDSATGADLSVDGGKTWGPLASLKISDGQGGIRSASASDVTHLRVTIAQIAPGATGQFEFHAIVR